MKHRGFRQIAFIAAWGCIAVLVLAFGGHAVWAGTADGILWFSVLCFPALLTVAILWLSSSACKPDYGLFGSKNFSPLPPNSDDLEWYVTSGRVGRHYRAARCLLFSWCSTGFVLQLISGDTVFVAFQSITSIGEPSYFGFCEIEHEDPQVNSPVVLPRWIVDRMFQAAPATLSARFKA